MVVLDMVIYWYIIMITDEYCYLQILNYMIFRKVTSCLVLLVHGNNISDIVLRTPRTEAGACNVVQDVRREHKLWRRPRMAAGRLVLRKS